jgi:hypothetical protein
MTFQEIEKHIKDSQSMRVPFALNEMLWCKPFAEYINTKYGFSYTMVRKDKDLDTLGIDVILTSENNTESNIELPLLIQLTHAREYDMSPVALTKNVDITGKPILDALQHKCFIYKKRNIDTEKLILIIQGVLEASYIEALKSEEQFMEKVDEYECFDGVYYISDKVCVLKDYIV